MYRNKFRVLREVHGVPNLYACECAIGLSYANCTTCKHTIKTYQQDDLPEIKLNGVVSNTDGVPCQRYDNYIYVFCCQACFASYELNPLAYE